MDDMARQMPEPLLGGSPGEDGIGMDLLRVRSVLRTLPRLCCPAGFEFRLQRRLADPGSARSRSERGWALGWAGLGLGLATAFVIAVVAFDFSFRDARDLQMAAGPTSDLPAQVVSGQGGTAGESPLNPAPQASDRVAQGESQQKAVEDSVPEKTPSALPDYPYHMVGGNDR